MEQTVQVLGVQLDVRNIRTAEDLPGAFDTRGKGSVDGVVVGAERIFTVNRAQIITLAARHSLPAIYQFRTSVETGGLMSYSPVMSELQRRAVTYVDRVLKGAQPARSTD